MSEGYSVTYRGTYGHYDIYPLRKSSFNFGHRIFCTRGGENGSKFYVRDERMYINEMGYKRFNTSELKRFDTIGECMEYIANELMGG